MSAERTIIRKQLKGKEIEMKDLLDVVNQMNTNSLDFEKLYNVSKVKAEASQLLEERDDLKMRLSDVEGAHQLLEGTFFYLNFLHYFALTKIYSNFCFSLIDHQST